MAQTCLIHYICINITSTINFNLASALVKTLTLSLKQKLPFAGKDVRLKTELSKTQKQNKICTYKSHNSTRQLFLPSFPKFTLKEMSFLYVKKNTTILFTFSRLFKYCQGNTDFKTDNWSTQQLPKQHSWILKGKVLLCNIHLITAFKNLIFTQ